MLRGRFAPTPSGLLHLGNVRTALLAWLQMRAGGGRFVLRMEDIDRTRSRVEWAAAILTDLRWLGLDWDEGPDVGGPYSSYVQSEREHEYREAVDRLLADGRLYPCYCSRADLLSLASAPHGLASEGPRYPGTCRSLNAAERAAKEALKQPSLRFAMPADTPITFEDGVAGLQVSPAGNGGDFVVVRADGMIGYQLAVVLDDAAMHITDVLRGADLLDSTPRQLALYDALGLPAPRFAHVPLLLGPDGKRLSKRHGDVAVATLRGRGVAAERVVGWLAYWSGLQESCAPVAAAELIAGFDLARVPREPVVVTGSALDALTARP